MGNRVEEVAQERGDTVLLLRTAPKEATTLAFTELPELLDRKSTRLNSSHI